MLAIVANAAGRALFGAAAGVFVAALAIGIVGGLLGGAFRRSPLVFIVPGVLILVPGSAGFNSLLKLLTGQTVSGIDAGFNTFVTAMAIAYGLMLVDRDPAAAVQRRVGRRAARPNANGMIGRERDSCSPASADRAAGMGVLAAACVSAFVVNANTSAVTILLPTMSKDTGTPVAQLQWAVTGYIARRRRGDRDVRRARRRARAAPQCSSPACCCSSPRASSSRCRRAAAASSPGRMIQGAAGSTILACGMSLLSVAASGAAQMRAITIWGAASAAGAAAGPLVGGVLVELSGWQGLFWIDAAIAAALHPADARAGGQESRDPNRSKLDRLRSARS